MCIGERMSSESDGKQGALASAFCLAWMSKNQSQSSVTSPSTATIFTPPTATHNPDGGGQFPSPSPIERSDDEESKERQRKMEDEVKNMKIHALQSAIETLKQITTYVADVSENTTTTTSTDNTERSAALTLSSPQQQASPPSPIDDEATEFDDMSHNPDETDTDMTEIQLHACFDCGEPFVFDFQPLNCCGIPGFDMERLERETQTNVSSENLQQLQTDQLVRIEIVPPLVGGDTDEGSTDRASTPPSCFTVISTIDKIISVKGRTSVPISQVPSDSPSPAVVYTDSTDGEERASIELSNGDSGPNSSGWVGVIATVTRVIRASSTNECSPGDRLQFSVRGGMVHPPSRPSSSHGTVHAAAHAASHAATTSSVFIPATLIQGGHPQPPPQGVVVRSLRVITMHDDDEAGEEG